MGDRVKATLGQQLRLHMMFCARCRTGSVRGKGCKWLREFLLKNPEALRSALGISKKNDEDEKTDS